METFLNTISKLIRAISNKTIENIKFKYYWIIQLFELCMFFIISYLLYIFYFLKSKYHYIRIIGSIFIIAVFLLIFFSFIYLFSKRYIKTIKINDIKYAIVGCDNHGLKLINFYYYKDFSVDKYSPYKWISYEKAYNIENDFKTKIVPSNISLTKRIIFSILIFGCLFAFLSLNEFNISWIIKNLLH